MLRHIREGSEALQALASQATAAIESLKDAKGDRQTLDLIEQRLEAIELSMAKWEARMEAELMKAQGKYSAARNAEERERTQRKAYEADIVDGPPDSTEEIPQGIEPDLQWGDGEAGPQDGVQPVLDGVEAGPKTAAMRKKFG